MQLDSSIDYSALPEQERIKLLSRLIDNPDGQFQLDKNKLDDLNKETIVVIQTMASMRNKISPDGFGTYVISMTHQASHIIEVMWIATLMGLAGKTDDGWFCNIKISPVFLLSGLRFSIPP